MYEKDDDRKKKNEQLVEKIEREAPRLPPELRRRLQEAGEPPAESKSRNKRPLVTVFGAGVSGLSAAHELVDRGFLVQVVEPRHSEDAEYECEVGGMAANQFGRVKETKWLHPYLFPSDQVDYLRSCEAAVDVVDEQAVVARQDDESLEQLLLLRNLRMLPVQRRFGFPWRILFDRSVYDDDGKLKREKDADLWLHLTDQHLEDRWSTNAEKLDLICDRFVKAYQQYKEDLDEELRRAEQEYGERPVLSARMKRREILMVEVVGHTDNSMNERENRALGMTWATIVRDKLVGLLRKRDAFYDPTDHPLNLRYHFVLRTEGSRSPLPVSSPRPTVHRFMNRVELRVVEHAIPGDHGYRFFPAYYRHIFDVMRRTPILDPLGEETPQTAFDHLVAPPPVALALEDTDRLKGIGRQPPKSIEELKQAFETYLVDMNLHERDLQRFNAQVVKFLTSCPERRRTYEELSWLHFADARKEWEAPSSDVEAKGYSERAEKLLREVSQALIAMAAEETDAFTHGSTSVQLLLDYVDFNKQKDMTLNGPTSITWLRHWKRYLRRQGVHFFVGSLSRFFWDDDEQALRPQVQSPDGRHVPWREYRDHVYKSHWSADTTPDFYVLALPYEALSDLVWEAHRRLKELMEQRFIHRWPGFQGDFRKLMEFDIHAGRRTRDGERLPLRRDENGLPIERFRYPLRDLSGIQFFFPNNVRFGEGHLVLPDAPWGLSSISQPSHWRARPSSTHGFLGQLSVDIGDFYEPYDFKDLRRKRSAWNCERKDIAEGVWRQMTESLQGVHAETIERPAFYHLDQGIYFGCPVAKAPEVAAVEQSAVIELGAYEKPGAPIEKGDLRKPARKLAQGDVVREGQVLARVALSGEIHEVKSPMSGLVESILEETEVRKELPDNARLARIRGFVELRAPKEWVVRQAGTEGKPVEVVRPGETVLKLESPLVEIALASPVEGSVHWVEPDGALVRGGEVVAEVLEGRTRHPRQIRVPDRLKLEWEPDAQVVRKGDVIGKVSFVTQDKGFEVLAPLDGHLVRMLRSGELEPEAAIGRIQTKQSWKSVQLRDARPEQVLTGEVVPGSWYATEDDMVTHRARLVALNYDVTSPVGGWFHSENPESRSRRFRVAPRARLGEVRIDANLPKADAGLEDHYFEGLVDDGKWAGKDEPLILLTVRAKSPIAGRVAALLRKQDHGLDAVEGSGVANGDSIALIEAAAVSAPRSGQLTWLKKDGEKARRGSGIAKIRLRDGRVVTVKAPIAGKVICRREKGDVVEQRDDLGGVCVEVPVDVAGTVHRWLVVKDENVEKGDELATIRIAQEVRAEAGGRLVKRRRQTNDVVVDGEEIGHLGEASVIEKGGLLLWDEDLPWDDSKRLSHIDARKKKAILVTKENPSAELVSEAGTLHIEVGGPGKPMLIRDKERIDYLKTGAIKANRDGVLIWLKEEGAEVQRDEVVALIRSARLKDGQLDRKDDDTLILSPASGAVRWSMSALDRRRKTRPDSQQISEYRKAYKKRREKDVAVFGEVCVPVHAPAVKGRVVDEMRVNWRIEHDKEVKQGAKVATVAIDVTSPASGRLEEVFVAKGQVGDGEPLGRIGERTPASNSTAFMINLPGQWKHRPGLASRESESPLRQSNDVTVAEREILYTVSHDRYVMAGNFMGTLTRLSTMESANESARHAVNAILRKLADSTDSRKYNGAGRLLGDYAKIWNPERFELPDVDPLKRLDKELFDAKVPHFIDVLRIPEIIDQLGLYDKVGDYPTRNLLTLLETAPRSFAKEWAFLPGHIDRNTAIAALDRALNSMSGGREVSDWLARLIEMVMKPPSRNRSDEAGSE